MCIPSLLIHNLKELVDATRNNTLCCEILRVYNVIFFFFSLDVESIMKFFLGRKGLGCLGTVLLLSCLCGGFKKSDSQLTVSDGVKQKNVSFKIVKLVHFYAYSTYLVAHLFKR